MTSSSRDRPDVDDAPSMLDLIRLSPRNLFPPGGRDLYRQIALLTEMNEGDEVLVASCGAGITAEYFAAEFGANASAVDEDPQLIERAESRIREQGLGDRIQFQPASMASLPYRDGVFDVVVAELGLTASVDPATAIAELVRVTRPGGHVVIVHLVWKASVDPERRDVLTRHLGARPVMMVELKRTLRELGVTNLHSEAWSDEGTAFRPHAKKPFPDFAELFSISEKVGILRRAWARWGWRGVRTVLVRERDVHRLLTRERILGLDMIKGTRVAPVDAEPVAPESPPAESPELHQSPEPGEPPQSVEPPAPSEPESKEEM
ncbi:MAG: methyltransferase domain-containing protein [Gemmatimonadales bacterium]|nr:MAG: methyltransferase domain-containing protein [Gemmatimonadales bacterium]